jgi:hypothetical protein
MSNHTCLSSVLVLSLFLALTVPASAQQITVQNGGTITVENGSTWDLNGATVDLGGTSTTASISETGGGRFANGQLTATRALNSPSSADPAGLGLQITASTDLGDVTVTRGHTVQDAPNNNEGIARYYDVNPSQNNSGLSAELTFSYNDAELNGLSESKLEFFKSEDSGNNWGEEGVDSRDATANTATLGGIESLSRWTLGSEDQPLPVELAAFEGAETDRGVELTWQTTAETNNAGFEIERSGGERAGWTQVGFVDGAGTSSESQRYSFTDADLPYAADTLEYRLRQVDVDGSGSVSEPIRVGRTVDEVELLGTHPNPAQSRATVRFAVPSAQEVTLRLYDVMGREVRTLARGPQEGRTEMRVGLSDLSSGIYFLRLQAGGTTKTQKMTVVR